MMWFVLALLAFTTTANAQVGMPWPGPGTVHSVASFTGIGDVVASAKGHWGTIAYSSAAPTATLLRLCQDDAVTGCGDVAAVAGIVSSTQTGPYGSACNTSTQKCRIVTAYDDSGGANCGGPCNMAATSANFPWFVPNAVGTVPAIQCDIASNTTIQKSSGVTSVNQPYTSGIASNMNGMTPGGNARALSSTTPVITGFNGTPAGFFFTGGSPLANATTLSNSTTYAVIGDVDASGNAGVTVNNNTRATGTPGTGAFGTGVSLCADVAAGAGQYDGVVLEAWYYGSQFNGTQITNVTAKMRANGGY